METGATVKVQVLKATVVVVTNVRCCSEACHEVMLGDEAAALMEMASTEMLRAEHSAL